MSALAAAWAWGTALILVTIAIHVFGITAITRALRRFWTDDADRELSFFDTMTGIIVVIITVAFALAALHGFESAVWAAVYVRLGVLPSFSDAMLYSVSSMTTRGSSGLDVPLDWRAMGAVESADGMLLFGISTAFLFTIMLRLRRVVTPPLRL
ncbi:MAG: hypothetical protein JO104_06040 [Candidatus Eremiobacteraeota bacterium]|nr:hypothetical protein [Candidatus Eremiobacteraeota bacterium]